MKILLDTHILLWGMGTNSFQPFSITLDHTMYFAGTFNKPSNMAFNQFA